MITLTEVAERAEGTIKSRLSFEDMTAATKNLSLTEADAKEHIWAMRYPMISLEFLRMRDSKGFPRFAVFMLGRPTCQFMSNWWSGAMFDSGFPNRLAHQSELSDALMEMYFADVRQTVQAIHKATVPWSRRSEIRTTVSQRFGGVIPDAVRTEIETAAKELPGVTTIVADAGPWQVEQRRATSGSDPLVIRIDPRDVSTGLLVAHFDTTPAEQYVMREFGTG